ncbi:MAG TPA: hypothetical protein VN695_19995 [Streptosporangiaceae bacterium]|nr:hypothetical protein [Streptosporangiaceae bacterium]
MTAVQLVVVTLRSRRKLLPNAAQISEYVWATAQPEDHLEHVRVSKPTEAGKVNLALYVLAADQGEAARLAGGLVKRMTRTVRALKGAHVQSVKNPEIPGAPGTVST